MRARTFLCALALPLAACDTAGAVGAIMVDPSGAPVAGATVSFACPTHRFADGDRVETDTTGKFYHSRIPDIEASCTMTVEKPGFVPKTLSREDVAYSNGSGK